MPPPVIAPAVPSLLLHLRQLIPLFLCQYGHDVLVELLMRRFHGLMLRLQLLSDRLRPFLVAILPLVTHLVAERLDLLNR